MKRKREDNIIIYYNEKKYLEIIDKLEQIEIKKVLKDDKRSKVVEFLFNGEKLVFKLPREKNRRKWQRVLSLFRGSESYREFLSAGQINKLGLNTFKPILAFEKKQSGFIVDSYFISGYIEGKVGTIHDLDLIKQKLDEIHSMGYLHGDSQLSNFIINDGHVYLVDASLIRNRYGKFGKRYEYIYLEESCHKKIQYKKNDIYYKGAKVLNSLLHWWGRVRKKLKVKK